MAQTISGGSIIRKHTLAFKTGDQHGGKDLYFCSGSGIAVLNFHGEKNKWKRETFNLIVPIATDGALSGETPPSSNHVAEFAAKNWCTYSGLNAVYNRGHAINSGYAVDEFRLLSPRAIQHSIITIEIKVACMDNDGILYRVGYSYELLLHFNRWVESDLI